MIYCDQLWKAAWAEGRKDVAGVSMARSTSMGFAMVPPRLSGDPDIDLRSSSQLRSILVGALG